MLALGKDGAPPLTGAFKLPGFGRGYLYLLISLLYLVRLAGPPTVDWAIVTLELLAVAISFQYVSRAVVAIAAVMGCVGLLVAVMTGATWPEVMAGLLSTYPILAFITLIQLIGKPIKIGQYDKAIVTLLLQWFKSRRWIPAVGGLVTFLLTGVEGMGSLTTGFYTLEAGVQGEEERRRLMRALMWGLSLGVVWAPSTAIFAIGASIFHYNVPFFLSLSVAVTTTAMLVFLVMNDRAGGRTEEGEVAAHASPLMVRRAAIFLMVQLFILVAIAAGQGVVPMSIFNWIFLVVVGTGIIWGFMIGGRCFWTELGRFPKELEMMDVNFIVFPSAGLLGAMVGRTAVGDLIRIVGELLVLPELQLALIAFISFLFTLIGIYPAITLITFGPIIAASFTIAPEFLALSLLAGACAGLPLSPSSSISQITVALGGISLKGLRTGWLTAVTFAVTLASIMLLFELYRWLA